MSTTSPIEGHQTLYRHIKRHLAVVSVLVALYPPLVAVVSARLMALAHQQDVEVCRTLTAPSGIVKHYCAIHNTSPLFGVVSVLTAWIFPAILITLVSGHLALYHQQPSDGAKWHRTVAVIGLVLGYTWAAVALLLWAAANFDE